VRRAAYAGALLALAVASVQCGGAPDVSSRDAQPSAASPTPPMRVTVSSSVPNAATAPSSPAVPSAASVPSSPVAIPPEIMDASLRTLDGKSLQLSDYKGKVLVLDIWATWCGPCRVEVPHLVSLSREYKQRGVEVVGLTIENPVEAREDVRSFAAEYKINYQLGWADRQFALALMNGRGNIPQTYVITRDGKILKRFIGFDAQRSPAMLREAIEEAVNLPLI